MTERQREMNIGDKVKIEATIVDYNEGAKTVKIRIEGLQEDGYMILKRIHGIEKSLLTICQYMKTTHYLMASHIEKLWML